MDSFLIDKRVTKFESQYYHPNNVKHLQEWLRNRFFEKHNINIGMQKPILLMEVMAEVLHDYLEMRYQTNRNVGGANFLRAAMRGNEYTDSTMIPMPTNNMSLEYDADLLALLNNRTIQKAIPRIYEKIQDAIHYNKMYNMPVYEKIKYTGFTNRPYDEKHRLRKDPMPILPRVIPEVKVRMSDLGKLSQIKMQ